MKVLAILVLVGGCSLYTGGDDVAIEPDAGVTVAAPDAAACPPPGLPSCSALPCGVIPLDCPRPEDASAPCYCPAPAQPGWCFPN